MEVGKMNNKGKGIFKTFLLISLIIIGLMILMMIKGFNADDTQMVMIGMIVIIVMFAGHLVALINYLFTKVLRKEKKK